MNVNNNFQWDLMVFELNGNKLNEFGSIAVVENNLRESGRIVLGRKQYKLMTERLKQPDWRDRFLAA